jgi:hypothetical protein
MCQLLVEERISSEDIERMTYQKPANLTYES